MKIEDELEKLNSRMDTFEGILQDYHLLLSNHMTDYTKKFTVLEAAVRSEIQKNEAMQSAFISKLDTFKWVLIMIASFTVLAIAGLLTIAVTYVRILAGG